MKRKFYKLFAGAIIALLLLPVLVVPVMAATSSPLRVATGLNVSLNFTSVAGIGLESWTDTFYAAGRAWVFYLNDDSDLCYRSAQPGGTLTTERVVVANTWLYAVEYSVWYENATNTVHYARHVIAAGDDYVVYRMGTPGQGGAITWAAAEQFVQWTPAELGNWRTVIAVDELHNPWIAFIDTCNQTGYNTYGICYLESSSTHNGSWTAVATLSSNWSQSDPVADNDTHAWAPNLCPMGNTTDLMQLTWSSENATTGEQNIMAVTFNASGNTSGVVDVLGGLLFLPDLRPDAFDVYDIGDTMYMVFTDNTTFSVMGAYKNSSQTWADPITYGQVDYVLETGVNDTYWIPTLSGYQANGTGEDLFCIVHNNDTLRGGLWYYGDNFTNAGNWTWTSIWNNTDLDDLITRHNAAYKYSSPITFVWQYTDDSDTPDTDDVMLWWRDNDNDEYGYYAAAAAASTGSNLLRNILPITVAIGVVLAVFFVWGKSSPLAFVGTAVIGVAVFFMVRALIDALL